MTKPRVGIIVGSNRRESINRRLAKALAKLDRIGSNSHGSASTTCRCTTRTSKADRPGHGAPLHR